MRRFWKYTPGFILLMYIFFFLVLRHPAQNWDRVINSDGKGYYAYLPAIFIYNDLNFRFVEFYENKYYPPDRSVFKEFRVDVKGKTVMVLTGDPPVADRSDPKKLDEHFFLGNALTVYGRTGTKLETAFKHGAAAVILIPPSQPARYVWENNSRENLSLRDGNERQQVKAQALVTADKAIEIFAAAGSDFEKTRDAAARPGFRAVGLSARITIRVTNQIRNPRTGSARFEACRTADAGSDGSR